MSARVRFDELVSTWLDDALDPEGIAELDALLVAKPEYARRFVRLGLLHGCLRELQRAEPGTKAPRARSLFASIARWFGSR